MRSILLASLCVVALSGCSSVSHQTALDLSSENVAAAGEPCLQAVETADTQNAIKWGRMVATPIITMAVVALAPALIGANAAFDYADRKNASNIREACGYEPVSEEQILADVAINTGVSIGLGAVDLGLGTTVDSLQEVASGNNTN